MKRIVFTGVSRRAMRRLPDDVQRSLRLKLARYAESGLGDVKALKGSPVARLRSGDYRIIFAETDETIEVHAIGHRKDIYT